MDKKTFYDIDGILKRSHRDVATTVNEIPNSPSVPDELVASGAPRQITSGEINMADVDFTQLALGQASLASDIRGAEANIRDKVGAESCMINKNIGDTGHRLEKSLGDNRYTIANEANGINKHIGDTRQEDAENFGHTRRDVAAGFADTRYNIADKVGDAKYASASESAAVRSDIKDARYDLYAQIDRGFDKTTSDIENAKDNILDRQFALGRDTMDLRAQVAALGTQVRDNAQLSALQTEKAVLQNTIEGQKNTQYLSDKIAAENEKTRDLINDLKYHDLNRGLVERNAELVECEADRREWRWRADQNQFQGQWAQLQSQLQAFASQLQETRQGVTNFGTMTGNAGRQQSTSNNA